MIKDVADWDRCVDEVNTCRDELLAEGRGRSKKAAEQQAAKEALRLMGLTE